MLYYLKKINICFLIFSTLYLQAETVEIISNMYTEEILRPACFDKIKAHFDVRITDLIYHFPITTNAEKIKQYLIFNINYPYPDLNLLPSEKKVLFMMEPVRILEEEAKNYSKIYTWDDDMIDNIKYFKFFFPDLMPMIEERPRFNEKKLCTIIARNWSPKHRIPILAFFSSLPKGEFEFYGAPLPNLLYSKCYRGRIPGLNCGKEKIDILKQYKFCLCIENSIHLNGYISEKIFPCFAAGCVPIYWGAPNIEQYIPKECFIDYRDFTNLEELYLFMKSMPETRYEEYIYHIQNFIKSDEAKIFSPEYFAETLYEAAAK